MSGDADALHVEIRRSPQFSKAEVDTASGSLGAIQAAQYSHLRHENHEIDVVSINNDKPSLAHPCRVIAYISLVDLASGA